MDSRPSREPRTKAGLTLLNLIREPLIYGVTDRMDLTDHHGSAWAIRDGICAIEDELAALPSEPPSDQRLADYTDDMVSWNVLDRADPPPPPPCPHPESAMTSNDETIVCTQCQTTWPNRLDVDRHDEPLTKAGRQLASDLRMLYQGVPLILGLPEAIVAKVEAEAAERALGEEPHGQ